MLLSAGPRTPSRATESSSERRDRDGLGIELQSSIVVCAWLDWFSVTTPAATSTPPPTTPSATVIAREAAFRW
jgi:hypothetical protein